MRVRYISFVLTLLCSSCAIYLGDSEESTTAPTCASSRDCHDKVGHCEANVCVENRCTVIDLRDINTPLPIENWCIQLADAGVDTGLAEPVSQCENNCDCFDDNVCTLDVCTEGQCQWSAIDGGCGSTVGLCRGTWCCTGETTCFQAYDNDSECEDVP